jgi:arginyl-tRNA synthetase
LGRSVEARWLELHGEEATIPEGGYRGEYIVDIARAYDAEHGEAARGMSPEERAVSMGHFATEMMVEDHKENLARFGVVYDVWYSQEANVTQEAISATLAELERRGHVYRRDGAVWLRTTTFGDDKDRVLVKSNGEPTYFLADIAYHRDKFSRGFKEVIDLWGPDHDGHVRRMKAAVAALGQEAGALEILIVQWVRLMEGGELARMSKRRGQIVPMKDLLDDIGVDASRFFFLMRSHDSHLDFDLELAKRQTTENPVYYVQYAHARISSILRQPEAVADVKSLDEVLPELDLLTEPAESALIRRLADFPEEVADAALAREPHRLTRYATDVATAFHKFYDTCRVLVEGDPPLRRARLGLAAATRIVLANSLALCGVSAPESM